MAIKPAQRLGNSELARLLQLPPNCIEATLHLRYDSVPVLTVTQHLLELPPSAKEWPTITTQFEWVPIAQPPKAPDQESA